MRVEDVEVVQIVPTLDEPCGISNFATMLGAALTARGVRVESSRSWTGGTRISLLHYHPELMTAAEVSRGVAAAGGPVLLLPHEKPEVLASIAFDGYVHLATPASDHGRPSVVLGHPAWTPSLLRPRSEIRAELGLPVDTMILGSSGLLRRNREFPRMLAALLPWVSARGWFVYLPTSRWRLPDPATEATLAQLQEAQPDAFRFDTSFKEPAELNTRLQACDLLWNWTNTKAVDYASGTAADHYASGSRLLISSRPQHDAVLRRPNVFSSPPDFEQFTAGLKALADLSWTERTDDGVPRHDPGADSWKHAAGQVERLLRQTDRSGVEPDGRR